MPHFDHFVVIKEEKKGEEGGREELTSGVRGGTGDTIGGKKVSFLVLVLFWFSWLTLRFFVFCITIT